MPSSLKASVLLKVKHHMQLDFKPSFLQVTPHGDLTRPLASLRWGIGAGCSRFSLLLCCFSTQMTGEHG